MFTTQPVFAGLRKLSLRALGCLQANWHHAQVFNVISSGCKG